MRHQQGNKAYEDVVQEISRAVQTQPRLLYLFQAVSEAGLSQSLFERMVKLGVKPSLLEVQYRMHPSLSQFPSEFFYDGDLKNGVSREQRTMAQLRDFPWPVPGLPMLFYNATADEEFGGCGTSFINRYTLL